MFSKLLQQFEKPWKANYIIPLRINWHLNEDRFLLNVLSANKYLAFALKRVQPSLV